MDSKLSFVGIGITVCISVYSILHSMIYHLPVTVNLEIPGIRLIGYDQHLP